MTRLAVRAHARWLAVPVAGAAVAAPWFVDPYTTATLARILVLGLVAVSVAVLTGVAGLPTLGQTAPFAAGAYAAATVALHTPAVGVVQVLVGAAAGAAFALVTVPLVVYARGVVVLMITLAIGELVVTAASRWRSVTGGTDGLAGMPSPRPLWGLPVLDTDRARYLYALAVVGVVVLALGLALRGSAGRYLRGCRDDEARMRASGHRVTGYLAAGYVVAGLVAGVAGSLLVTTQQYLSPADFGFDVAALLLLSVVIGGTGSLLGSLGSLGGTGLLLGALGGTAVVLAARDWLSGLLPGHGPALLGVLFVVASYAIVWRRRGRPVRT